MPSKNNVARVGHADKIFFSACGKPPWTRLPAWLLAGERQLFHRRTLVDDRRPSLGRLRPWGFRRFLGAACQGQSLILDGAIKTLFCPEQVRLLCRLRAAVAQHFADVLQSDAAEECADGARISQRMGMGRALAPVLGFNLR